LTRLTDEDDDLSSGSAELYLSDGELRCHLTLSWDVEVYEPADVSTTVGVDLNDDPLYAVGVVDGEGEVLDVQMQRGAEYRHHRERLKRKRAEAMERDDLRAVKGTRLTYDRYTDHITNVASRRIVDLAAAHTPCVIHLEDLTRYRETAKDPIHDWPFEEIQRKICYKATEAGVPVQFVNPQYTSTTCRKCGQTAREYRDGREFACRRCGYEVHADVNAALNIAQLDPEGDSLQR
jgi:IS605 OrfB family transposase